VLVMLIIAALLGWRLRQARADDRTLGLVSSWVFVGILQGAIGYVQYFNDIPEALVAAHVSAATALWVLTVFLAMHPVAARAIASETSHAPTATI